MSFLSMHGGSEIVQAAQLSGVQALLPRAMRPKSCWKLWMRCYQGESFLVGVGLGGGRFRKESRIYCVTEFETVRPIRSRRRRPISRRQSGGADEIGHIGVEQAVKDVSPASRHTDRRPPALARSFSSLHGIADRHIFDYPLSLTAMFFRDVMLLSHRAAVQNDNRRSRRTCPPQAARPDWCPSRRSTH